MSKYAVDTESTDDKDVQTNTYKSSNMTSEQFRTAHITKDNIDDNKRTDSSIQRSSTQTDW